MYPTTTTLSCLKIKYQIWYIQKVCLQLICRRHIRFIICPHSHCSFPCRDDTAKSIRRNPRITAHQPATRCTGDVWLAALQSIRRQSGSKKLHLLHFSTYQCKSCEFNLNAKQQKRRGIYACDVSTVPVLEPGEALAHLLVPPITLTVLLALTGGLIH